jgi:hypothetical protein
VALLAIAVHPTVAQAQDSSVARHRPPFDDRIVIQANGTGIAAFDLTTGDIWTYYDITSQPKHYKLSQLGSTVTPLK